MVPNERRKFIMTVGTDIMKELESEEQGGCEQARMLGMIVNRQGDKYARLPAV